MKIVVIDYVKFMNLEDISDMSEEIKRLDEPNHLELSDKLIDYLYENKIQFTIEKK